MSNVLSQEEVDSLLGGMNDGKVETETDTPEPAAEHEKEYELYDFGRKYGAPQQRMPALRIINERFTQLLRSSLSAATRTIMDVSISSMEATRFGEFSRSLPVPTSLNIFRMEPLMGYVLLALESTLAFAFVDTFFGGKIDRRLKVEGRPFTIIESKVIQKVVKIILKDLEEAWSNIHKGKMVFVRSEMDPQFANIITSNEHVIVTQFFVDFEMSSGVMTLCIPHATIEPIREKLARRFESEKLEADRSWKEYIREKIKELDVDLSCTLGRTKITGSEIMDMKVGDVMVLDQRVDKDITVLVENIPKLTGYPGAFKNKRAIRINEFLRSL